MITRWMLTPALTLGAMACVTTPKAGATVQTTTTCASDPFVAVDAWATKGFEEAGALTQEWTQAHMLRMWRVGPVWYALLGPAPDMKQGAAVRLTLQSDEKNGWRVVEMTRADATDLWPVFGE